MNNRHKIIEVLTEAGPAIQEYCKDNCYIIGSAALVLAGIELEQVSDIDLLVSKADAAILEKLWQEKQHSSYQPGTKGLFRSDFARFDFKLLDLEIMGELAIWKDDKWEEVRINASVPLSGTYDKLRIPSLEEQKRIFLLFGREKDLAKAKMIDYFQVNH